VGGALGSEGAFHFGEQGQKQERDAGHAFVGGVDRDGVGQYAHADEPGGGEGVELAFQALLGGRDSGVAEFGSVPLPRKRNG
jgi:hypothetical protein